MTQPTNTYATNDMIGIREDLSDVIYNIAPIETPFLSMVARTTASNTLHEWQTDSLDAAAENKVIEGDNVTAGASTPSVRLNNRIQQSEKAASVTSIARSVNTAGRADELDYQMLKRGKELRRDMEFILLSNKAKVTGSDVAAPELAGIGSWIATNTDFGTSGVDPAGTGAGARTDGTQRAFTEDQLKTVMQEIFTQGGMPDTLMLGAFNRQIFSSFSAGRTNVQKVEDKTLHASFDVYASDFGTLKVIPNRLQRARDALILQMDMWAVAFVPDHNMAAFDLSKTGHSDQKVITSAYTLEARQQKSSGIVADLTTS